MSAVCISNLPKRCNPRYFVCGQFCSRRNVSKKSKKFSATLNLPKTGFPLTMRNVDNRERKIQEECGFDDLYAWQSQHNKGKEFILHDGPPYANGKPHVGHALNKILKDVTSRYHMLRGHRVHYVPGWDCHGMPIEHKALTDIRHDQQKLTPLQLRDKARKFALGAIKSQMDGFRHWGVMADWSNCYYTFDPKYEAKQLDVFYDMFEKGYIYEDVMPVFWSPSIKCAIAESELEYDPQHSSTAVYVRFPVISTPSSLTQHLGVGKSLYAVIWTTTPWSLPANQALCYSDSIRYALLEDTSCDDVYMCEESFVEKLQSLTQKQLKPVTQIQGSELKTTKYRHPLTGEELPFLPSHHVTTDVGTGLVHTAPAHGQQDFQLAINNGILVKNLLDDDCKYTSDAGPQLEGISIGKDAENAVLDLLGNHVLHKESYTHSYPCDWRTKEPVIIRASRQWFIDTRRLKDEALASLRHVQVKPTSTENGMVSMLENRTYWCISRQRIWGVPIPVFYHRQTRQALLNRHTFDHIRGLILKHGSDCWWTLPQDELLPTSLLEQHGLGESSDYTPGKDILDIWFDSGTSWNNVLDGKQADVYMEGIDQFGGWFQTSLLTSVAVNGQAPYKQLVVHGFIMDEDGRKMSKSLGNVVDPGIVIHGGKHSKSQGQQPGYGVDVMRWFMAANYLHPHIPIGNSILDQNLQIIYDLRKLLRFLLGNIGDLTDGVDYDSLWPQDKHMLYTLHQYGTKVTALYESLSYPEILSTASTFQKRVSSDYCRYIKDRCYCDSADSLSRTSSLTTQFHILDVVTRSLAPIIPHMAEDIYMHYPASKRKKGVNSIFKTGWFDLDPAWDNEDIIHTMQPIQDIKEHVLDLVTLESSNEADLIIYPSTLLHSKLEEFQTDHTSVDSPLCEIFQMASTTLSDKPLQVIPDHVHATTGICKVHMKDGFTHPEPYVVVISPVEKFMCDRCRRFTAESPDSLCQRCDDVISNSTVHQQEQ